MNNDLHTLTSRDFLDALVREQHLLEDPLQKVVKKKKKKNVKKEIFLFANCVFTHH